MHIAGGIVAKTSFSLSKFLWQLLVVWGYYKASVSDPFLTMYLSILFNIKSDFRHGIQLL